MADSLQRILADAKAGKFSAISGLSDNDVANVWENVASYIEQKMASQKGVHIPNLGTFSFAQNKLDVGNNKYILLQRPVFNISEKFAQTHGLQFTKYTVPGNIPCPPLNYAALSFESPFDRDTVESCVREIINSVSRAVAGKRNVELSFSGIGRLQIRDSRVKMRFYKDFIGQMDGSGALLDSMQNRAGTVDSVMSNRPFSRAGTSNTLILPRIQPGSNTNANNPLPPVAEVDDENLTARGDNQVTDNPCATEEEACDGVGVGERARDGEEEVRGEVFGNQVEGDVMTEMAVDNILRETETVPDPVDECTGGAALSKGEEKKGGHGQVASRAGSRMAMPVAMASGLFSLDDLMPQKPPPALKSAPLPEPRAATQAEIPLGSPVRSPLKPPTPPRLAPLSRPHSSEDIHHHHHQHQQQQQQQQQRTPLPPPDKRAAIAALAAGWRGEGGGGEGGGGSGRGSTCGHYLASHNHHHNHHQQQQQQQQQHHQHPELCHLCHNRRRRNIPVSFTEERKRREEEEDRVLQQYQSMKDTEDMLKEQEKFIQKRHELQKMAAFNVGVSEVVSSKKKAKDTHPQKSYIFDRRPLTPPRFPKQEEYLSELTTQLEGRKEKSTKQQADKDFMDRLEQVQLAEDLAKQRQQFIKDKEDQVSMYKKALDVQMQLKPLPIPARQPDNEMFGKNDVTNEILMERRRRAHRLYQDQQETVEQRKREAILKRLSQQKRDELVLKKTKEELIEDRSHNHKMRVDQRKQLEADWKTAADCKHARDLEDRLMGLESGQLIQETCDGYKRCRQCQRKVSNCGESNLWSESYYVPGSRIMV